MPIISSQLIKRIKSDKARRRSSALQYREQSRLAFIVHSFNRVSNVDQLVEGIRRLGDHELIVCDDGSIDGSHEKWMSYLDRPNDFLIHSNDLHEIRMLDRAIRFSRAELLCIVQDDDAIPRDVAWLTSALEQFARYPRLAIVGGFMGFGSFHPDPELAQPIWGPAPFQFVSHVNIGPYFVRKQAYEALGGWDFTFSEPGEPGICFDNELCLRAWLNDYQVGYSFVPFKGPPGEYSLNGGTMLFSGGVRRRNQLRNQRTIYARYQQHAEDVDRRVQAARLGAISLNPGPTR